MRRKAFSVRLTTHGLVLQRKAFSVRLATHGLVLQRKVFSVRLATHGLVLQRKAFNVRLCFRLFLPVLNFEQGAALFFVGPPLGAGRKLTIKFTRLGILFALFNAVGSFLIQCLGLLGLASVL